MQIWNKTNKMKNVINGDFDLISYDNETDSDSDNEVGNETDNDSKE